MKISRLTVLPLLPLASFGTVLACKSRGFESSKLDAVTVGTEKEGERSVKSGFREMVILRLPADEIVERGCFLPGNNTVPEPLRGIFWMKENPLPDYLVTFEGATFVENAESRYAGPGQSLDTTAYLPVWGENAYTYYSGKGGSRILNLARRFEAYYRAEFYNGFTTSTIVPHVKAPFLPVWFALPREKPWLLDTLSSLTKEKVKNEAELEAELKKVDPGSNDFLKFTMDQWGDGYYRRRSIIPGIKAPGEYNLIRIMDQDGNKIRRVRLVHEDYIPQTPPPKGRPFGVVGAQDPGKAALTAEFEGTFTFGEQGTSAEKVEEVDDIWEAYVAKARAKTCESDPTWSTCASNPAEAIALTQIAVHKDRAPEAQFRDYAKVANGDLDKVRCKTKR